MSGDDLIEGTPPASEIQCDDQARASVVAGVESDCPRCGGVGYEPKEPHGYSYPCGGCDGTGSAPSFVDLLGVIDHLHTQVAACKRHPKMLDPAYEKTWLGLCAASEGLHAALDGWPA